MGDTCTAPDLQAAQEGEILGQAQQARVIQARAILQAVLRIHDILGGSGSADPCLTNEYGSCYFRH